MNNRNNEKIDFVILWVDGNDEEWLKEKNQYSKVKFDISNSKNRFRDWNILKYWFRGIEKNAPWVNKIFFITYGHLPDWLNINHPKLRIVNHKEFIPEEYLPTFNSNVIQFYLNRISDLSEKFIMFDDDQFVLNKVVPEDFFKNNKICDNFAENVPHISKLGDVYPHSLLNNIQCINSHYNKRQFYQKNFFKVFNFKNGFKLNLKTLSTIGYNNFIGIYSPHICQAYTKKHYDLFWKYCKNELDECSKNKFRDYNDLTTFLIRYIELLEGDFVPRSIRFGKRFELSNNNGQLLKSICNKRYKVICINDSNMDINFDKTQKELVDAFEKVFPKKSSFEI